MTYWDDATPRELERWLERGLDLVEVDRTQAHVDGVLETLLRCEVSGALREAGEDAVARKWTARTGDVLAAASVLVRDFVFDTSNIAGGARDDEQFKVSWRRSAIQILFDLYPPVIDALGPDWREPVIDLIDSIDFELRRMGRDYGRLPDDELPRGLPGSHWWWWPEPKPGYQRWPGWDPPP